MKKETRSFKENKEIFNTYLQQHRGKIRFVENDFKQKRMNPRRYDSKPVLAEEGRSEANQKSEIKAREFPVLPLDKLGTSQYEDKVLINIGLVGDCGVGKTSMITSYTSNDFPSEHVSTIFDKYGASVICNQREIKLNLW